MVKKVIDSNFDRNKIFEEPIDGCVFVKPNKKSKDGYDFVKGEYLDRIKDLDEIPSPYLNGMLDKFFDGKLTPVSYTHLRAHET